MLEYHYHHRLRISGHIRPVLTPLCPTLGSESDAFQRILDTRGLMGSCRLDPRPQDLIVGTQLKASKSQPREEGSIPDSHHPVPRLLSVRTSLTLLVMEYVSSSGDMATISWMPPVVWLLEYIFPPSEELERPSGCWFSLLPSSARIKGSWELLSGSVGLGGGDGEDLGSVGLAVGHRETEKAVTAIWNRHTGFGCLCAGANVGNHPGCRN